MEGKERGGNAEISVRWEIVRFVAWAGGSEGAQDCNADSVTIVSWQPSIGGVICLGYFDGVQTPSISYHMFALSILRIRCIFLKEDVIFRISTKP